MGPKDRILAIGWDLGLEVEIWAPRLGFGPKGLDMSLKAEIWAWRLGEGGTKEKEKISLCESIGHQPLWGRCPKRAVVPLPLIL